MSVSALMSLGMRAMLANYGAMQTTGHNIANASVDGYSRQQVELATSAGQFTGAGFFGRGVDIQTVARAYDGFLTAQAQYTRGRAEFDRVRNDQLTRLEDVFKGGEQGIGAAANEFLNAMVDVASRPQDLSARQVVLARAADLASRFSAAGGQLDALQTGVTQDLRNSVTQVNDLAQSIAQVNDQIAKLRGTGAPPNDLLDQRDKLVTELGGYIQVNTIAADDGTLGVFIGGGQRLILGNTALKLQLASDDFDSSRVSVGIAETNGVRALPEGLIGAGTIGGLLHFQNQDLTDARTLIGQMAAATAGAVNAQQALGLNIAVPNSSGAPIFALAAPTALAASTNARDSAGNLVSTVNLAVIDASQLRASEYLLANDGSGWQLTRLSDGAVQAVTSGSIVDGLQIDLGTPVPAATDRFLLQPVTRAANSIRCILDDPRGLAAASPVTAALASTNTGTAAVSSLAVVSPAIDPNLTATIAFTSDNGDYTWELRDRTTNALNSTGVATWTANTPIALNGFQLQLSGVPKNGDLISVTKTAYPNANNGNALALLALRNAALVGRVNSGVGPAGGSTLTDAWASALADVGVRVQGSNTAVALSAQVASAAKQALASKTGVNLDEEAARLMQYQQGYQAAAKVLQMAQSLFDTLIAAAGR